MFLLSRLTIFDKAISGGDTYDEQIAEVAAAAEAGEGVGENAEERIFFELALADLRDATKLFAPVHERTDGVDGWASLEVSPLIADDAEATIAEAAALHAKAERENLFIKIPGTEAGRVANSGEAAVQVGNFEMLGGSSSFWFNGNNSDCWNRWLQPGEACNVEVNFGAQDAVAYTAQLRVSANGYGFTADLSGEGGRAVIDASPNPADFGALTVGAVGQAQTITLTNTGNIPAGFFIGIVAGGDSGSFQLLSENCTGAELMPSASCTAQVRFRPQGAGPKAAYMAFFGDNDGGAMVGLRGEGVAPAVTLAPAAFDFGPQPVGSGGEAHAFAVRNDAATPLELSSVAIAGADLDQFVLVGDECTGEVLAPAAQCLVRVRFAPGEIGAKLAKLRVGSEAGAFVATLAGTGTDADTGFSAEAAWAGHGDSAADRSPLPRSVRKARHRRFVQGETLSAGKLERPRRVQVRASSVPR